ncbi:MAG: C4-dicarboxylate ABC transporter, partial [Alphaproteobacteria bacterium]|nr:C4-dicarboxylate ABC transporter [Alphaproteobacteria bacterium]
GAEIAYLPGYDGTVDWAALVWLCARLLAALYLLASALARFDRRALHPWEWLVRLVLAGLVMVGDPMVHGPALAVAAAVVALHMLRQRPHRP